MPVSELIDDLRGRINPVYASQPGTESHERRLCAEALEAQRDRINELEGAIGRGYRMLLSEPDTKGALFKTENILREALELAAKNLISVRGRHHTEQAYKLPHEAVEKVGTLPESQRNAKSS